MCNTVGVARTEVSNSFYVLVTRQWHQWCPHTQDLHTEMIINYMHTHCKQSPTGIKFSRSHSTLVYY